MHPTLALAPPRCLASAISLLILSTRIGYFSEEMLTRYQFQTSHHAESS